MDKIDALIAWHTAGAAAALAGHILNTHARPYGAR